MYWEMVQDDLREKRKRLQPIRGGGRWGPGLQYPWGAVREGERPQDPKGEEMGSTPSVSFLLPSLGFNFPSTKRSGSQRALLWTYSGALLGDPFQNAAPIHIDFEKSIPVKYILHSGRKYPRPGWRQQLFDWSPCLLCASTFSLAFSWDDISKLEFRSWLLPSNPKEKAWVDDTYRPFKIWIFIPSSHAFLLWLYVSAHLNTSLSPECKILRSASLTLVWKRSTKIMHFLGPGFLGFSRFPVTTSDLALPFTAFVNLNVPDSFSELVPPFLKCDLSET